MIAAAVASPANARRVLVIDDEPAVLRVIGLLLERHGFHVDSVPSARDGLTLAGNNKYHVILSDIIMPELDGAGFVREQMGRRPLPIIIVSVASESGELVLAALDAGADAVVVGSAITNVDWLVRDNPVPTGSVLLTGTGLVPPDDYTLEPGHVVAIEIDGIGVLTNTVAA